MLLGLALTLASAFTTNLGFLLRHRGAVAAPDVDVRHPLRSAVGLFRSKWWTVGYVLAAIAYALHVAGLALAPLSIVQAVLAGGLVLLGVIAERWFGFHLGRREWTGVVLASIGLATLTLTAGGETGGKSSDYSLAAMLAWESALVGIGTLLILAHRTQRHDSRKGILLGVAAGLLFTVSHVAVKAATGMGSDLVNAIPFVLIALAAGIGAFFASARSLQIGEGVAVIAVTSIASNASSIPAGIVVFGDPLGEGAGAIALRCAAFLLVVAAATLIPGPTRAGAARRRASEAVTT
jgi:drug/metabolite transporter (DMT)-like permease